MTFIAFVVTILVVPGFPEGATIPRWSFLFVALAAYALFKRVPIPRLVILTWCGLALATLRTPYWPDGLYELAISTILLLAFCIGRTVENMKSVFTAIGLGLWLNSAVIIVQSYGWTGIPQTTANGGLFINRNMAVEAAALVTVAAVAWRSWWLLLGFVPTLLAGARAPLLALGLVGIVALWNYSRFYALMALLFSLLAVAVLSTTVFFAPSGAHSDIFHSLLERYELWRDVIPNLTFLGHGLGSFETTFPFYQDHTHALAVRFDHAHNDYLQIAYATGILGLLALGLVMVNLVLRCGSVAGYVLAVLGIESCFGFPLYMPVTGMVAFLVAGHAFGNRVCLCCFSPARPMGSWARVSSRRSDPFRYGEYLVPSGPPHTDQSCVRANRA